MNNNIKDIIERAIKRLLRKWLRRKVIQYTSAFWSGTFDWIYDSPLSTWRDKLMCLRTNPDDAKLAYRWLIGEI